MRIIDMNSYKTKISGHCIFCGKGNEVEVSTREYMDWQNGKLIQNAMPNTSLEIREFLISGMCPSCQVKIFG
jgi:hypothetical protein